MANVCINTIYFCSEDKELLLKLFNKIRYCYDSILANDIYSLLRMHGYMDEEIEAIVDRRDDITSCDGVLSSVDGYHYFEVETYTAWMPHMEVFYKLVSEKYDDKIRFFYCSEENGCEIYTTNDIDGIFFDVRFRLDYGSSNDHKIIYFESFKELVKYVKGRFTQEISQIDDLCTIKKKIIASLEDDDDRFYCEINRFDYDYERSAA